MADTTSETRAPRSWTAPIVSTVVALPLACLTFFFAALTPMACDSCADLEAERFEESFDAAFAVYLSGLLAALAGLVAACVLAGLRRRTAARGASVLAPVCVVLAYLVFLGLVDLP
ncbi:hypothetical protein ACLIYP_21725 [Streptomyces nanhaiensis]|uniref:hypothetical protein n=1 Tax=Streptomyces nanhaiensis TaxID=679319 RepID=UPI00399C9D3E